VDWGNISRYQKISEEFITLHRDTLKSEHLKYNYHIFRRRFAHLFAWNVATISSKVCNWLCVEFSNDICDFLKLDQIDEDNLLDKDDQLIEVFDDDRVFDPHWISPYVGII
jgi:hypothetical protein